MANLQSPINDSMDGDESEWEYEYHETETEDFYVTLDLSSNSEPFSQRTKKAPIVVADRKDLTTAPAPTPDTAPASENADQLAPSEAPQPASTSQQPDVWAATSDQTSPTPPQSKSMQILDLHTTNPLISHNSQLYSCDWTTTLGTDMLFASTQPETSSQPASSSPPPPQPATSTAPHAILLAATRIKLSARPVTVSPRADYGTSTFLAPQPPSIASAATTGPSYGPTPAMNHTTLFPIGPGATPERQNQAAFLTKLMNIKRAKGESDELRVNAITDRGDRRRLADEQDVYDDDDVVVDDGQDGGENGDGDGEWGGSALSTPRARTTKGRLSSAVTGSGGRGRTRGSLRGRGRGGGRGPRRGRGRGDKKTGRAKKVSSGMAPVGEHGEGNFAEGTPQRWGDLENEETPRRMTTRSRAGEIETEVREERAVDWQQRLREHLYGGGAGTVDDNDDGDNGADVDMDDA